MKRIFWNHGVPTERIGDMKFIPHFQLKVQLEAAASGGGLQVRVDRQGPDERFHHVLSRASVPR
jgi:hypothetical protein